MLSLVSAAPSVADEQVDFPVLDEVVVTASRFPQARETVSASLRVLDREEIRQSPARTVGELLAGEGLGPVRRYPGALTSVSIRGFRTDTHGNDLQGHVLVLLDGRRAGTGNLAKIMTCNVERIEIIRGPGAVQYGSAGLGGVINVITRRGRENGFFVEAGGGSFDGWETSAGATAFSGDRGLDFAGTVTAAGSGDYDTGSGDRFVNTGVDSEIGVSANLGYSLSAKSRLGAILSLYEVNGAGTPGYFSRPDSDDSADKSRYSLDLGWEGEGVWTGRWQLRYFFGQDNNRWNDPVASNPDGWDDGLESTNDTDQQGAQAQAEFSLGPVTIQSGIDWLRYDVENSWSPQKTSYDNPALFLLTSLALFDDRVHVDAGLRHDWYSVEMEEPAGRDEDETRLTPQVGLAWTVMEGVKLRGRYAQGFMMPSADQLGANYSSWGTRVIGNPDLDPEKSETWEAGLDFTGRGLDLSLTWFSSNFEEKIVTSYLADGSQTWVNSGDASINGLELELGYDLGVPLDLAWEVRPYLNGTFLSTWRDESTGRDLEYVSGTTWAAGLVVGDGDGFFCRFNLAYTGDQMVEDWSAGDYPAPVVRLDSFIVADLVASYRFYRQEGLGSFTLRAEGRNLFDEDYAWVKGYPMPGRGFFLGLRWEY